MIEIDFLALVLGYFMLKLAIGLAEAMLFLSDPLLDSTVFAISVLISGLIMGGIHFYLVGFGLKNEKN